MNTNDNESNILSFLTFALVIGGIAFGIYKAKKLLEPPVLDQSGGIAPDEAALSSGQYLDFWGKATAYGYDL